MPVIHARPVISGTIAGRPATVVSSATRPVKRVPITDSLTNGSPIASSPRACSWASRADVPVPHGERSSQPGWIDVAARASAPSRPGRVEDDVAAAGDAARPPGAPAGRRRRSPPSPSAPRSISSPRARRVDLDARPPRPATSA